MRDFAAVAVATNTFVEFAVASHKPAVPLVDSFAFLPVEESAAPVQVPTVPLELPEKYWLHER